MTHTRYKYIVLDQQNRPIIEGTTMKVVELVGGHTEYGWSPSELQFQYPYLTLGQIHSALAYYWDHKDELDRQMQADLEYVEEMRRSAEPFPLRERLRAQGSLR